MHDDFTISNELIKTFEGVQYSLYQKWYQTSSLQLQPYYEVLAWPQVIP